MNTQIPIYRAKKINSDEYIIGWLLQDCFGYYIIPTNNALRCESLNSESIEIDPTTLAIHFPGMTDSQGNKIFASLSEDGKGGDCTFMQNGYNEVFCWDILNACVVLKSKHYECKCFRNGNRNETTFNIYTVVGVCQ